MKLVWLLVALAGCSKPAPKALPPVAESPRFSVGKPAGADDTRDWPTIHPDGSGLPLGRGSVSDGARVYAARCASCHGATGVEGPLDVLVGRAPAQGYRLGARVSGVQPVTIGNWWPRATSLFDYLRRAMPPDAPGSLSDDDTYALCAFLLHRNDILPADATLDRSSLSSIQMPAASRFVVGN